MVVVLFAACGALFRSVVEEEEGGLFRNNDRRECNSPLSMALGDGGEEGGSLLIFVVL